MLVILRPGLETFQPASLMVLVAAFGYAINIITTKKLTATDSTFAIVFWMNVMQTALGVIGRRGDVRRQDRLRTRCPRSSPSAPRACSRISA